MSFDDPEMLELERRDVEEKEAELHYLRWFYTVAPDYDFDREHTGVPLMSHHIPARYTEETGRPAPTVRKP